MNKDNKKNLKEQSFTKNFPHILKNNRISPLDKLVYAQIHSLSQVEGYCWATNQNLSEMLATSPRNIQLSITKLIEENLITRVLSTSERKLFLVEVKETTLIDTHERTYTPTTKELTPLDERTYTPTTKELTPLDERTYTPPMNNPSYIIDNRIDNLKDNRIDNKIDNNNSKNSDFVEELHGVANITSTNTPEGGDNIYSKEMEEYVNSLIRIEVEETLEEKIEKVKTKSSIKEEEFDSPQGNIEDVFSDEEKNNALNYSSTKEESKIDFNYLDNLSEEELEIELKNLENNLL